MDRQEQKSVAAEFAAANTAADSAGQTDAADSTNKTGAADSLAAVETTIIPKQGEYYGKKSVSCRN